MRVTEERIEADGSEAGVMIMKETGIGEDDCPNLINNYKT